MRRIEARLVAAFEGKMGGDNSAVLEDTDFVGKDVDIEGPARLSRSVEGPAASLVSRIGSPSEP